jgi:formate dehydrogenase
VTVTTRGRGQIRALVINCGNPVVSGPDGAKLDAAMQQLDLLVAIDFVQRESHRHAHWLLPAVHWLERDDLMAFTSNLHDEPYVQYGFKAVEPPPGVREEWRIFVDLAIAMRKPLFGVNGVNSFVKATRGLARLTGRRDLEFSPHWIDRLLVATGRKVNGRKVKWREIMAHPHGLVLGPREFGHFKDALRTDDKKVHAAPREFVARTRELLAQPHPQAPDRYPFQLANRRNRHSMNSWLSELPGLHRSGRGNEVVIIPLMPRNSASATAIGCGCSPRSVRLNLPHRSATGRDEDWSSSITDGDRGSSTRGAAALRSRTAPTATCSSTARRWTHFRRRRR